MTDPLLAIDNLSVHFPVRAAPGVPAGTVVKAVDGIDLRLARGKTLALVGESGCGKSTLGYAILGLIRPTGGHISFEGREITAMSRAERGKLAGQMQIIFQDPSAALNPKMAIGESIEEPLIIHGASAAERAARVPRLLDLVGLPASYRARRPGELSGGQRQRVVIARALALSPKLLVCDEPVSALDVSIRSQILNLLIELQQELGLTYLFISHDLSVVRHIADDVAVMYLGTMVEQGATDAVFGGARHPYTEALLSAIPLPDPRLQRERKKIILAGDLPSRFTSPSGCPFYSRCPIRQDGCTAAKPPLRTGPDGPPDLRTACFVRNGENYPRVVEKVWT